MMTETPISTSYDHYCIPASQIDITDSIILKNIPSEWTPKA